MAQPTLDQRTPICRLKFESDDTRNYNWNKIDDVIGRAFTPDSPLQLPPLPPPALGSITGPMLAPGSAIHGVWVGTAIGTALSFTGTPAKLAEVLTDATEDPTRWSLVLAQLTLTLEFGASGASPTIDVNLDLQRGDTVVQSRELFYDASNLGTLDGMDLDIPVTIVRIAKPGDTSNAWSLWGSAGLQGGGQALRSFCQLHTIQFT
jgi:hypothetical protein